jgi:hypothetical protein
VLNCTEGWVLVVQDDAQHSRMDLKPAVIFDKPELSELVHEEIDARARVVPIISASISCESFGRTACGLSAIPYRAPALAAADVREGCERLLRQSLGDLVDRCSEVIITAARASALFRTKHSQCC